MVNKVFKVKQEHKVFKVNLEEMVNKVFKVNLEEMEQMEYQDLLLQLIGRTAR
jgi:hypothetical protein